MEPLALQPALHVDQRQRHRVDLALGDGDPQLFQRERGPSHPRVSITKVYRPQPITVNRPLRPYPSVAVLLGPARCQSAR
ncbi:hypothetical protein Vlu01_07940 [Micromonospora lutea]|uniref:Uncharacterized protein n=1 Tax=Micromonospora lutea TaxID=419825 RepID=A0ABQ4IQK8_9ACTN|nr:hypothetical protein Vlu01_07940 [Micromonospora lutea]